MWAKRFRTLVRKIRQVRQNSLLRTRKIYLTKLIFLKRIFNVTFSDFQPFFFRFFPNFEKGSQNCALPIRKTFWIKIAYLWGKLLRKNFWAYVWEKLSKKFLIFCKTFSPRLSEVQYTCPLEKLRNFFCWPKNM